MKVMEKVKYHPDEIDRIIDEELSRIETANAVATGDESNEFLRRSMPERISDFMRGLFKSKP